MVDWPKAASQHSLAADIRWADLACLGQVALLAALPYSVVSGRKVSAMVALGRLVSGVESGDFQEACTPAYCQVRKEDDCSPAVPHDKVACNSVDDSANCRHSRDG